MWFFFKFDFNFFFPVTRTFFFSVSFYLLLFGRVPRFLSKPFSSLLKAQEHSHGNADKETIRQKKLCNLTLSSLRAREWFWSTLKMTVVPISTHNLNISNAHMAKVVFSELLSVRGSSWRSILHRWIWINHQVQMLKPSQTQHASIAAERGRNPWSHPSTTTINLLS